MCELALNIDLTRRGLVRRNASGRRVLADLSHRQFFLLIEQLLVGCVLLMDLRCLLIQRGFGLFSDRYQVFLPRIELTIGSLDFLGCLMDRLLHVAH